MDARYPGLLVAIVKAHAMQMTGQARREKRAAKKQNPKSICASQIQCRRTPLVIRKQFTGLVLN